MKNYKKAAFAGLGLAVALFGAHARAAVEVNQTTGVVTATGTNVTYTFNATDLGLFGPVESVSISGDTLMFAPSAFSISDNGFLDEFINIDVSAHAGYQLSSFSLEEGGTYTAGAYLDVDGTFEVRDFYLPNDNHVGAGIVESLGVAGDWTAQTGTVTPLAGWGANGIFDQATLTVTNVLIAQGASISKNYVSIYAIATPVPEAETYAMLLAGLGLVGFMARRRSMSVI